MEAASNSNKMNAATANRLLTVPTISQSIGSRLRVTLTAVMAIVALVVLVVFLLGALEWRRNPFFGAMLTPYMVVDGSVPITTNAWPGLEAGLQRLDQLVSINRRNLSQTPGDYAAARESFLAMLSRLEVGSEIDVVVNRPARLLTPEMSQCAAPVGDLAVCSFTYTLAAMPDNDFVAFFVVPYLVGVGSVVVGLIVFYLRPNQLAARMTAMVCLLLGVFMAGSFDVNNTYRLIPLWLLSVLLIAAPIATLALTFPVRVTPLFRYPWLQYAPFAAVLLLTGVAFAIYLNPPSAYSFPDVWQLGLYATVLAGILLAVNVLHRRRVATSAVVRDQANTVLIGLALTLLPVGFWVFNNIIQQISGQPLIAINSSAILSFFILPTVALAYAVIQYRSIDTDKVISQSITYGLLLVALIVGYFMAVYGVTLFARDTVPLRANDTLLIGLTIFVIAALFLPVRTHLQQRIDRIYFRKRTNYRERSEAFARTLTTLGDFNQIVKEYRDALQEALSPSQTFLFLPDSRTGDFVAYGSPKPETDVRFERDSSLIKLLKESDGQDSFYFEPGRPWPPELVVERSRLNILKPLVIARLRGRKDLIAFVAISAPRSNTGAYHFEELSFIEKLSNQVAISLERAMVVESLEKRVNEQEIISSVSRAVNFTIQFNDLLELIYAQTTRLLDVPNFYIALYEQAADKLYYAFFVEDDERLTDHENRRWLMGRDLNSEVVRSGSPLNVDDYAAAMALRNSPIIFESRNMKAWMGVPLIAGTTSLGVMSVAMSEPGKTFSADQLKTFDDIASLAATSLEKARLFAETDLRARQLGALNAISQKLSSELNVENLLELITESAVEILEGEAGSLLLTTEDDKSLEFRVAVGSSGKDLIGRRFSKDRGLAGEVATKGKPVIVNDAANDPRWGGEMTKGEFSTSAILATPLIAQGKVIGVLEVINKKNGGIFVKEDTDLLMTFAGQAAVAIENARLFEMTDKQLAQRVSELQTLEKIDVELNRSLDLQKVADITMRWAIVNSAATAGVLGIVEGTAPNQYLRIISMYGYKDEDFPEGAEDRMWPLDRGIVSRVMRTKQPDLATDIKIDPSYVPSLRHSLCQMTVPMMAGGEINALLVLEKDVEPRLNLVDMSFITRLAEHASIAITNAQINQELTRANESKSEFVSFVAHELKTPMTSMKGFADLLTSGVAGKLNEQQSSFLNTIRSNIDRMNTLVSDLNDVTKLQTNKLRLEFAEVDFRNVVNETLRPLHRQIEERAQKLVIQMPDRLPPINADQNRMIQVMTNLVSNAYKYTPHEGDIYITAEIREKNLDSKGRDQGPVLHISVRDTGIGMSEEDLMKLFTPYFRSENPLTRQQPGTGLGLTIVRGIIQGHGGEIWVESELNKGTTFNFTVPIVPESEALEPEDATQPTR
ncbi:MAG: GAF domain-containing protein [Anaerolineae bacterium]|nr:GAF domain-containing protein [Anaerolineae bacterium]